MKKYTIQDLEEAFKIGQGELYNSFEEFFKDKYTFKEDNKFETIPDYGDKMTIEEFNKRTEDGYITYDDGSGYYATEDEMSRVDCFGEAPKWATHIIWFNK